MNTIRPGSLPAEYAAWTHLVSFAMSKNRLTGQLPSEYKAWVKLRELRMNEAAANIAGVPFGTLPPEYAAWRELEHFDVSLTGVSGTLPPEYGAWAKIKVAESARAHSYFLS